MDEDKLDEALNFEHVNPADLIISSMQKRPLYLMAGVGGQKQN